MVFLSIFFCWCSYCLFSFGTCCIAITEGAKELLWIKEFIKDIDFEQSILFLFCDNQSAIYLTKHSTFHSKSKHISRKYHWIRMALEEKLFEVEKIHTDDNLSDMLTKVVIVDKHEFCRSAVGSFGMKHAKRSST